MVKAACVQYRAFPHEPPLEVRSRARRVVPLQTASVEALLSCTIFAVNCGWYRGRNAFRPDTGMDGFFYFKIAF